MSCKKCHGYEILRHDAGDWKKYECLGCGNKTIIFRNPLAKELYYEKIKKEKEEIERERYPEAFYGWILK